MTVVLKDAIVPNLVQTLEGTPAFVHGGPFGNIAHGCNSVIATRMALKLADYVITEAGFGSDLGAEKFFDIKCRVADLKPVTAVVVATIRALKMHGGIPLAELGASNPEAVKKGIENLEKHCENVRNVGLEPIVAINKFPTDTDEEIDRSLGVLREDGSAVGAFRCVGERRRRRAGPRGACAARVRGRIGIPACISGGPFDQGEGRDRGAASSTARTERTFAPAALSQIRQIEVPRASATCLSASPRRRTRFRTTQSSSAALETSRSTFARQRSARARDLW